MHGDYSVPLDLEISYISSSRVAPHLTDGGPGGQLEETGVNAATVTSGDGVSNEFCAIDDVLLTMILANTVNFSVLPKLSCGGKHSYAYVVNILRRPRRRHLHPPTYEYVFRLRIIKRMRKPWKPGPFLLPFSDLGTRLHWHCHPVSCLSQCLCHCMQCLFLQFMSTSVPHACTCTG